MSKIHISNYVSYKEVVRSHTATRLGIDNIPNESELENIKILCNKVFDPLRRWVLGPVKINSLYRSEALNTAIGGSKSSQHLANNGAAMDIDDNYGHATNLEMFDYIRENLEFDQWIAEFPIDGKPQWIHVSYKEGENRGNIYIAVKENGKTRYKHYSDNKDLLYG